MQVRIDIESPTLEAAHHPLSKLQFVADTIVNVNAKNDSDGFYDFDQKGLYAMGEIVQESINELINAGYIHREIPKDSDKRFGKSEYHVFDRVISQDEFEALVVTDKDNHGVSQQKEWPNHQEELSMVPRNPPMRENHIRETAKREGFPEAC